uniref:Uncharacterized protein n=1 Tax=Setaria italica TaxID=4555 RepID=K4A324_SETIT
MDKLVAVYYGGTVKRNEIGGFDFEKMVELPLLFSARPTFSGIMDQLKERLRWTGHGVDAILQGVIDVGSSKGLRIKRLISIGNKDDEVRALDVFVQKVSRQPSPPRFSLDLNNSPIVGSPLQEAVEVHVVPSAPTEVALTQDLESADDDSGCGGFADVGHDDSRLDAIEVPACGIACEASNCVGVRVSGDDDTYEATRAGRAGARN